MQPKSEEELRRKLEEQLKKKKNGKKLTTAKRQQQRDREVVTFKAKTPYPVPLDFYNSPRTAATRSPRTGKDSVMNVLEEARGEDGAMLMLTSPARARLNSSQVRKEKELFRRVRPC